MNLKILKHLASFAKDEIPDDRKAVLKPLISYIQNKITEDQTIRLHFICTHNSRRSHLGQIWSQVMAYYYGIKNICSYSGGTESTALAIPVLEALSTQGFEILKLSENINPVYAVKYAPDAMPVICFSKVYDHRFNPEYGFCAIMTCDSADEACPIVFGAEERIAVKYTDPKIFDGTENQQKAYSEASLVIGREMWYVFNSVAR